MLKKNNLPALVKKYFALALILFLPFLSLAQQDINTIKKEMVTAANNLLQQFSPSQQMQAHLAFNDADRFRWSNEPENMFSRKGITLGELNDAQKKILHHLLQTALSEQGYLKVINILRLDDYLKNDALKKHDTAGAQYAGHDKYWFTIFGNPSLNNSWGWRLEGHHLSLHFTISEKGISCTPMFTGSHPAIIPDGAFAGLQNMFAETNDGWQLILSMNKSQQQQAIVNNKVPDDILTRTGKENFLQSFEGIGFNNLSAAQQQLLWHLIQDYIGNLNSALASFYLKNLQQQESKIYFGWQGSTQKGSAIYYRIHAPGCIIEYCSRLHNANHVHTLWRELDSDFGE